MIDKLEATIEEILGEYLWTWEQWSSIPVFAKEALIGMWRQSRTETEIHPTECYESEETFARVRANMYVEAANVWKQINKHPNLTDRKILLKKLRRIENMIKDWEEAGATE
jgi:hypothetical protein